jgi:hypothetical protein
MIMQKIYKCNRLLDDLWLANLDRNLSAERVTAVLDRAKKVPKEAPIGAYLYMLVKANDQKVREVMKMSDAAIFERVFEGFGIIERHVARGEEKKAIAIARTMKTKGEPLDKIIEYTGLTEQQISAL